MCIRCLWDNIICYQFLRRTSLTSAPINEEGTQTLIGLPCHFHSEYEVNISNELFQFNFIRDNHKKILCIIYILIIFWLYDLCSKLRIIIFFHCPFIPRENPPQAVFPLLLVQQPYFSGYKVHVRENDITANSLL